MLLRYSTFHEWKYEKWKCENIVNNINDRSLIIEKWKYENIVLVNNVVILLAEKYYLIWFWRVPVSFFNCCFSFFLRWDPGALPFRVSCVALGRSFRRGLRLCWSRAFPVWRRLFAAVGIPRFRWSFVGAFRGVLSFLAFWRVGAFCFCESLRLLPRSVCAAPSTNGTFASPERRRSSSPRLLCF